MSRSLRWTAAAVGGLAVGVVAVVAVLGFASGRDARAVRRAVAEGRFADARAPLARWLRARPDSAEAHLFHARVALGLGRYAEATDALKQARERGAPDAPFERVRGLLLAKLGRPAEAEPILVRVLNDSNEPDPEVDEALAEIYLESFRLEPAARVLDRWARDDPRAARPYLWLTEIDRRTASIDTTPQEQHYREALRRDPNLAPAHLGLAELLRQAARGKEAAEHYAAYLALRPDDPAGHLGAARNARDLGDEPAATRHLDRALALAPDDPAALRERAAIDLNQGKAAEALSRLDRAVRIAPFDAEALVLRSEAFARLGRDNEAKADRAQAQRLSREQLHLQNLVAQLRDEPGNNALRAEIAAWMLQHGQAEEAARWARLVLSSDPDHPAANGLLADYHARRGETGLANFYRLKAATRPPGGNVPP